MHRILGLALALAGALSLVSCDSGGGGAAPNASGGSAAAKSAEKLIFTAIPDDSAEKLKEQYGAVAKYLSDRLGRPVEYLHVENYAAAVTALATGQAHLSWMGGVTTVQSDIQTGGKAVVVCCRDIDKKFVTYFIANPGSGIESVSGLAELAAKAEGKTFTFGSKGSTSGHLMPRHFFTTQVGEAPEKVFRTVAYSGSHDKTLAQVADGSFDVGALNYATYDKSDATLKEKAPIVYKTPAYVDYSWVAHEDLGAGTIDAIRKAFLALDPATEPGKSILGAFKAGKFVAADMKEWDGIRAVMESGVDIGS